MGIYTIIYTYLALLNIFYIYGMDAAFMKYTLLTEAQDKKKVFSTAYVLVTLSTLALTAVLLLLRLPFGHLMAVPAQYTRLIYYVILILLFDTLFPFLSKTWPVCKSDPAARSSEKVATCH